MKNIFLFCMLILTGCNSGNQTKKIYATLEVNGKDSICKTLTVPDSVIFSLAHCVEVFEYPPHIPADIYWSKPDSSELKDITEYGSLNTRHHFDENNRLDIFFYQGSLISGVFPLIYIFQYAANNSCLINEIEDPFYKVKYRIEYDSLKNIEYIEKLDSLNLPIEKFAIKIK